MVTFLDVSLKDVQLEPRLRELREAYFRAVPEVCIERPRLITQYSLEAGLFYGDRITSLQKARVYRRVLETRAPIVRHSKAHCPTDSGLTEFRFDDRSPLAGSTTTKFKGVPLYPEFMALSLWPELWTLPRRKSNPYFLTEEDVQVLNSEVFPEWINSTIAELARDRGTADDRRRLQLLQKFVFFLASKPNCISHTIPEFSRAIGEGLGMIALEAMQRKQSTSDEQQRDFYQAICEVMGGITAYARRLSEAAADLARFELDSEKKAELNEIARIYARVPEQPAQSFREGLTTIWVCWTAIHLENPNVGLSLGRLDQVLYGLYQRDIEAGRLTVEQAVQLLGYLWLKIGDHVPTVPSAGEQLFGGTGSNQAITIGGVDKHGQDAVNDLTYVILRSIELMKLRDPNLNARYFAGINDKRYLRRLCDANLNTGATPALHNDRAVIRALTHADHTLEQARDYGITGCVEPGNCGRFYGHTGAILLNLPSVLELTLFNGRHRHTGLDRLVSIESGNPSTLNNFDEFKRAFYKQIQWMLGEAIATNESLGRVHQQFYPTPILSALFEGPMHKGKDLADGGAVLNGSGIAVIGLADVADSLTAIETLVYNEKKITFAQLIDALLNDFASDASLLARLRNPEKVPKFGNDDPRADGNVAWIIRSLEAVVRGQHNYRGGEYRIGYWSMTNHAGFGRFIGATPNGRRAGENFASGLTPCSGVTASMAAALQSIAHLPGECIANGMAVNLKFTPDDGDRERMLDEFVAVVDGYFDAGCDCGDGGMEIQFNVTSHREFLEAVKDPKRYDELLVRVSGYTAYFKDLTPQMQKEIIDRTEYRLSTGHAVSYGPFPLACDRGSHGR